MQRLVIGVLFVPFAECLLNRVFSFFCILCHLLAFRIIGSNKNFQDSCMMIELFLGFELEMLWICQNVLFFCSRIPKGMKKIKWDTSLISPPASQDTASDNAHVTKIIICCTAEVGNKSHDF